VSPHDVRAAAGTTWAVYAPERIEVAQELLGHQDIRTTTVHYNRAKGIQASRQYWNVLATIRPTATRESKGRRFVGARRRI
jgi:integrase